MDSTVSMENAVIKQPQPHPHPWIPQPQQQPRIPLPQHRLRQRLRPLPQLKQQQQPKCVRPRLVNSVRTLSTILSKNAALITHVPNKQIQVLSAREKTCLSEPLVLPISGALVPVRVPTFV